MHTYTESRPHTHTHTRVDSPCDVRYTVSGGGRKKQKARKTKGPTTSAFPCPPYCIIIASSTSKIRRMVGPSLLLRACYVSLRPIMRRCSQRSRLRGVRPLANEEYQALVNNGTWSLIERPPSAKHNHHTPRFTSSTVLSIHRSL